MHDAPPAADVPATLGGDRTGSHLSAAEIERILGDFRVWLEAVPADAAPPEPAPVFDLHTIVAQFTALRHDVNLQTKAVRAVLETKPPAPEPAANAEATRKLLVDLADALSLSHVQISKAIDALDETSDIEWPAPPDLRRSGFWNRLRGASPDVESLRWADAMQAGAGVVVGERDQLRAVLAGSADGYALGIKRIERAFPQFGLEPIECEGRPFDPETMEVVDVVGDSGRESGTVAAVVRAGYRVGGRVFRFAQVAVTR